MLRRKRRERRREGGEFLLSQKLPLSEAEGILDRRDENKRTKSGKDKVIFALLLKMEELGVGHFGINLA